MKPIQNILIKMCCAGLLWLSSCGPDDIPEPRDYPINNFVFNTFLFAEGTWWAFYDSTTGKQDTINVKYSFGQHQNLYEGDKFMYSQYYYTADWIRSKTKKKYRIEYISKWVYDWNGRKIYRININSNNDVIGNGSEAICFENSALNDSIPNGSVTYQSTDYTSYFTLLETGDSLKLNNVWHVSPYRKVKISQSVTNDLSDIHYVFQEYTGLISHTIGGNYLLVDKSLIPMIK
jgi:hypothetical protein